jgi:hypothetical protein
LMRSLAPSARGSSGEPGTANTSRPYSSAKRAVISEPERLSTKLGPIGVCPCRAVSVENQ